MRMEVVCVWGGRERERGKKKKEKKGKEEEERGEKFALLNTSMVASIPPPSLFRLVICRW